MDIQSSHLHGNVQGTKTRMEQSESHTFNFLDSLIRSHGI